MPAPNTTTRLIRGTLVTFGPPRAYVGSSVPKRKPTRNVSTITQITKPTRHATNKGANSR